MTPRHARAHARMGAVVIALSLLAACAGPGSSEVEVETPQAIPSLTSVAPRGAQPRTASSEPSATAQPTAPRTPATLQFSGTTTDGQAFEGESLAGRPVLLWFWAPWCPTCRRELPEIETLARRYDGDVQVVGVGSLDSTAAISRFAADTSGFTAHLVDQQGSVWRHFRVTQQSSLVVLDAEGHETFRAGYGGSSDLADEVAAVAGQR